MLYLAAQASDNGLVADSIDIWRDDSVEFAFDGALDFILGGLDDHTFTAAIDGRVMDWGVVPSPAVQRAVEIVDDGYVIELGIPLALLQAPNWGLGKQLGFNIGLHDDDDGGDWDSYMVWEGNSTVSQPQEYGRMLLVGGDGCYYADVHPNADHGNPAACDGDVDVADVQRVAGCWMRPISGPCPGALDLDESGAIDVADVQAAAENWGWQMP
jgi:hypothetical protein